MKILLYSHPVIVIRDEVDSLICTLLLSSEDTCDWFTQLAKFNSIQFNSMIYCQNNINNEMPFVIIQCNSVKSVELMKCSPKRKAEVFVPSDRLLGLVLNTFLSFVSDLSSSFPNSNTLFFILSWRLSFLELSFTVFVYPFERFTGWLWG